MSPRDGQSTRDKILDVTEELVLANGFAGTSIDRIIAGVGVTKGTFFYHFDSKAELARALIERYAQSDLSHLHTNMARAEALTSDPLQQLVVFVGLFLEVAEGLTEPYPGCLFASYCYESGQLQDETVRVAADTFLEWRRVLAAKIDEIRAVYPPRAQVDSDALADMLSVVFEGAYILSRVMDDPSAFAQQLRQYRTYIELLFSPAEA